MDNEKSPIDFTPLMREAQEYAKRMKDIVDKNDMSEDDYSAIMGHRTSLADSFCYLIFGRKFDEIRKKYIDFVNANIDKLGDDIEKEEEE